MTNHKIIFASTILLTSLLFITGCGGEEEQVETGPVVRTAPKSPPKPETVAHGIGYPCGARPITSNLPDVGTGVAQQGPDAKISAFSELHSVVSSLVSSHNSLYPSPIPPMKCGT